MARHLTLCFYRTMAMHINALTDQLTTMFPIKGYRKSSITPCSFVGV